MSRYWRARKPWFTVVDVLLGIVLAALLVLITPLMASSSPSDTTTTSAPDQTSSSLVTTTLTATTTTLAASAFAWPKAGSAAIAVPQLAVMATSPSQPTVPIASLTKLMTVWVVLHKLPLAPGQRGPCRTVTAHDVDIFQHEVVTGQSSVKIELGMTLCESTLLRGLLVRSAGDYVELLVEMTKLSKKQFVAEMNNAALALGLVHTHYVDVTGISPRDISTAKEQILLTTALIDSEPIVRNIVALSSVSLPLVGQLPSYTPLVGQFNVVGVKSGFTDSAGACDVMETKFKIGSTTVRVFAVVLGQHGAVPLTLVGWRALHLTTSVRNLIRLDPMSTTGALKWIGSSVDVVQPPTTTTTTAPTTTTTTTSTTTSTTSPPATTTTGSPIPGSS